MKHNRILPLATPFFVYVLLELFYFKQSLIYVVLVFIFLSLLFTSRQFIQASKIKESFWSTIILPSSFTFSLIFFVIISPNNFLIQILFFFDLVFLYLYYRTLYYYLLAPEYYKDSSLQNLSAYGNFAGFYFLSSAVYGVQVFVSASVWLLMLTMLIATLLIVYQVTWANKIDKKTGLFYILISGLVITEIAWSVSFLSLSYFVLGLILSVSYYTIIGLLRFYLQNALNKKLVKMYLIFGLSSILLVLLTSRWV